MIKAGSCLCHMCGNVSTAAYYSDGTSSTGFLFKRDLLGRPVLTPFSPKGKVDESVVITPSVNNGELPRIPYSIMVDIASNGHTKTGVNYIRHCPLCAVQTRLFADQGAYPMYVIAVLGKKSTGKSSWIHSLSTPTNLNSINYSGHVCEIDPYHITALTDTANPTSVNELGKTALFFIKKNGERVASVLLVDTAGELFEAEYASKAILDDTAKKLRAADAYVFIDPAGEDKDYITPVYNRLRDEGLLDGKKIAYVVNKADNWFEKPPTVTDDAQRVNIPLLTKDTFPPCNTEQSYGTCRLIPRMMLEHSIVMRSRQMARMLSNRDCRGFVVKSCSQKYEGGEKLSDFSASINVMDPLIWLLNGFDIYPIDERTDMA